MFKKALNYLDSMTLIKGSVLTLNLAPSNRANNRLFGRVKPDSSETWVGFISRSGDYLPRGVGDDNRSLGHYRVLVDEITKVTPNGREEIFYFQGQPIRRLDHLTERKYYSDPKVLSPEQFQAMVGYARGSGTGIASPAHPVIEADLAYLKYLLLPKQKEDAESDIDRCWRLSRKLSAASRKKPGLVTWGV